MKTVFVDVINSVTQEIDLTIPVSIDMSSDWFLEATGKVRQEQGADGDLLAKTCNWLALQFVSVPATHYKVASTKAA